MSFLLIPSTIVATSALICASIEGCVAATAGDPAATEMTAVRMCFNMANPGSSRRARYDGGSSLARQLKSSCVSRLRNGRTCSHLERREDRARPTAPRPALARQPAERVARLFQLGDFLVERLHPRLRQLPRARPVLARVEVEKLLDLLQREARRLGLADEAQPAKIVAAVAPDFAVARWCLEEAPALIIADGFDTHAPGSGELSDAQRLDCLTLYHGTEAIWRFARLEQRE